MKVKARIRNVLLIAFAVMCFSLGAFFLSFNSSASMAYAATMPKYTLAYSYTHYYHYNTGKTTDGSATNTYEATVKANGGKSTNTKFYLYSSSQSGTANLPIGGAVASSSLTITLEGGWQGCTMSVKNSSGTVVGSQSGKSYNMSGLSDGTYTFTCSLRGSGWNPNPRAYAWYSMECSSSFVVDATAPSISGASTSTTGKYTNSAFTVSASDSRSGVENLYMMSPSSSRYTAVGTSRTVTAGSANGLYRFYAKDKAGNTSATYYVYYDTSLPSVNLYKSGGSSVSGNYVNTAFYVTASDTGSGVSYLQYTTPSKTSWTTYTSGSTIAASSANGLYQFRAIDKAGNISATKKVYLDTTNPTGTLYGGTSTVSSGGSTKASFVKFVPSDNLSGVANIYVKVPGASSYTAYASGSQYTVNGTYYFYCTDNAGNTSTTYSVTLDNIAPVMSCAQTEFYSTTEYDFTVKATDATSNVTLYYKTPLMSSYAAASGGSFSVTTTETDGKYYFYAQDSVGNVSETKWIELKVTVPTATIERDNTTNHYRVTWEGSGTGRLNDNPYTKGTWISTEGEYTFVITNSSNRSNTYHFTITHAFVPTATKEPTCTEQGYTRYECLTCSISYLSDYVDANGHSYTQELIGETCTEGAFYLYTCSTCGHQYKSEYLTTGGHKYDKTPTAATCTERGYTTYKCTVCDWTYRDDYTAALGHNYKLTVTEPTCMEGGSTEFECKRCFYTYIGDYTPAKGHDYETSVVEPTCTERGHTLHTCKNCSDEYKTDETIALGHYYTEETKEVSCVQDGCIEHTCTRCGYKYETNVVKALGHKYVSEVSYPATCTDDGCRHYLCSRCGEQYDSPIPAFGHNYEITDVKTNGGQTIRTYACTVCGHSYTQDLGDQYEEVSNYVEYLFNLYKPYMWWVFLATAGVWSIAMGIAIIVANKNEEKQKAKKMLVNYAVGLVVIAAILLACPYLVKGIASLVAG